MATVLAVLALAVTLPATLARALGWEAGPWLVVVALTPVLALGCVLALVPALLSRRAWLVVLTALVAAVQLVWLAPLAVADGVPSGPSRLTVATVNLGLGAGSPQDVVELVRIRGVDLLAVQELTPEARVALREAGLDQLLGHSALHPEPGAAGIGLWSRTEIVESTVPGEWFSRPVVAAVGTRLGTITMVVAHPAAPGLTRHDLWSTETGQLVDLLAALPGPVVVAGDLNTTRDHVPLRRLEDVGYRDAADETGAGLRMTFPVGRGVPALVVIDHVLVRGVDAAARAYDVRDVPGSDHRLVVVDYA